MNFKQGLTSLVVGLTLAGTAYQVNAKEIYLPGMGKVDTKDKISGSQHFTWGEATREGERIPDKREVVDKIIKAAAMMEEVRHYFGDKPVGITSWYRPPEINRKVAKTGKTGPHTYGYAVDFTIKGINPNVVSNEMDKYWGSRGGVGKYSSKKKGITIEADPGRFTHMDLRGHKARWAE